MVVHEEAASAFFGRSSIGAAALAISALGAGPLAGAVSPASRFYTVPPCRVVDTRDPDGPFGGPALAALATRTLALAGQCGTSPTARAISLNLTVTGPSAGGNLTLYPAGSSLPGTSSLNYGAGRTRANNAIAMTGTAGGVSVYCTQPSGSVHLIVDVNGYFDDPANNQPPVVSAGAAQTVTLPAGASLTGSAMDDGLPAGSSLTYAWSTVSGPGAAVFGTPGLPATSASFSFGGTYVLRLSVSDSQLTGTSDVTVTVNASPDLRRFLDQGSFGPSNALISHVQSIGMSAWIDEQIAAPMSSYPVLPLQTTTVPASCNANCQRDNYSMYPLQRQFFTNALYASDQLRQRVAWALHKIFVVSGRDVTLPSWMSPYLRTFDRNAFGSYRQLLSEITLNPAMGDYLNMAGSSRSGPNENYAREVLQLFTVGLVLLDAQGQPLLDGQSQPIPTYDQTVVTGFAKVFTGWNLAPPVAADTPDYITPMVLTASRHDTTAKTLLGGVTLLANHTGTQDLNDALDNIFNHPNVGPFVGKLLIQSLVTSNPSPAYVGRVAAVFANDGTGTRGNLGAVVRAILLDPEARGDAVSDAGFGHLCEPVLLITGLLRALDARSAAGGAPSDGYLAPNAASLGQDVFRPGSVFSYYSPSFVVPGTGTVAGPEFALLTATTSVNRANFVNTMVFATIPVSGNAPAGTSLDFSRLQALAGNPSGLVDELNRLLMHGSMSAGMKNSIVTAVQAVPASNTLQRARQAVYLVATSSQYQVER